MKTAPRARGDGPVVLMRILLRNDCSPRTRGWTHLDADDLLGAYLLPAHAGMDPGAGVDAGATSSAPRARGDGPQGWAGGGYSFLCSPRTRGWTRSRCGWCPRSRLLPAHAGMDPIQVRMVSQIAPAPRARGDGPVLVAWACSSARCSPRTRGWTHLRTRAFGPGRLLPAHAGMDPSRAPCAATQVPAPRARGDGPDEPRTEAARRPCSPRTRGWTHGERSAARTEFLLPAHAGMDPRRAARILVRETAPRARGDGPDVRAHLGEGAGCSPRTRGWTRGRRRPGVPHHLLPAHAGMDRLRVPGRVLLGAAPRARGDGPALTLVTLRTASCSPRTRGWTQPSAALRRLSRLLPAHAGMDPVRLAVCGL